MSDFINNISQFIQEQFPAHYRDQIDVDPTAAQRAVVIDFMEAYYEWVESVEGESFIRNRQMFEFRDIDQTPEEFVKYFRNVFLRELSYDTATDDRYVIKHILDFYRSKGSPASIKLLLRLLFNVDAEVYFPGKDVLRASDSRWIKPTYVEVVSSPRSVGYVNKRVFGSISGASAFVEAVITKRVNNRLIDIIYLSDTVGTFVYGDVITDDGTLIGAPKVIGSLSGVTVQQNNVGGNAVGDIFNVVSNTGINGTVRVTSVINRTGAVEFSINDGGYGYTTDDRSKVYVSDIVVLRDNTNTVFEEDDTVFQRLEKIYLEVSTQTDNFISDIAVGGLVEGINDANTSVSNGSIMEIGTETINNIITPYIIVQSALPTFIRTQEVTLTTNAEYVIGSTLEESRDLTLTIDSANGSFVNGEIVYQREFYAGTSNTVSLRYAFGEVDSANGSTLIIRNAFGGFEEGSLLIGQTSGAFANTANVVIDYEGTFSLIIDKTANNQYQVVTTDGNLSGNNKVRGLASKVVRDVANVETVSPTTLRAANNEAVITSVANTFYTGVVIGQDNTSIGIAKTSNTAFKLIANTSVITNQNDVELPVNSIATGAGASFEIGSLENTETIVVSVERIVDENIADVKYEDIYITGEGSGIGYVDQVNVIDGGNGYTNSSTVTFEGGGYLGQEPLIIATGNVTTDANGVIVSIGVTNPGEGYFNAPTIDISDGSGANLSIDMIFGYGFPEDPISNANTIIADVLVSSNVTIGTIASLKNIFRGRNYTGRPYVKVVNPSIALYRKQDQIANISLDTALGFTVGEIITQANTSARGLVISANSTQINLRNLSFDEDFEITSTGGKITGADSSAVADINTISYDDFAEYMGDNAVINNFVVESDGTINTVAVVTSGLGYSPGESVTLVKDGKSVSGTAIVQNQGLDAGYWKTRTSHINSEKKLQDNNYYQEYSYDIKTDANLNEYRDIVLDLVHLAGTKLFTTVVKSNEEQVVLDSSSTITQS